MNTYWKIISWLGGRKCFLVTMYSILVEILLVISSIVLAILGKLTSEWVEIFKFYSGYSAVLVIGYVTGNVKEAVESIRNGKN